MIKKNLRRIRDIGVFSDSIRLRTPSYGTRLTKSRGQPDAEKQSATSKDASPSDFSIGMGETPSAFAGGFVRFALRLFLHTH